MLCEKAIDDFAKSYRVGGLTQSRYPVNEAQYIPSFSMFFVLMLYEHTKRFNNLKFTKKYLPVADGIIDWFRTRLDGYMVRKSNLWDFIDWAEEYDRMGRLLSLKPMIWERMLRNIDCWQKRLKKMSKAGVLMQKKVYMQILRKKHILHNMLKFGRCFVAWKQVKMQKDF